MGINSKARRPDEAVSRLLLLDPISEIDMRLPEDHGRLEARVRRRNSHDVTVMVDVTKKGLMRKGEKSHFVGSML